jgi:UDP-N-acetylglucosamine kinase
MDIFNLKNKHLFLEEEFQYAKKFILEQITRNKFPCEHPKAYILGGQSGSGKTTLHKIIKSENVNVIIINGDEYRFYHPRFSDMIDEKNNVHVDNTTPFAHRMIEELVEDLSNKKYNIIIEGTLRTYEVPEKTALKLISKGYDCELLLMGVKKEISYLSTILRYELLFNISKRARKTPKEYHDRILVNIVNNLNYLYMKNIFKNIRIYDRYKICLYNFKITPEKNPSSILDKSIFGYWTIEEYNDLLNVIKKTIEIKRKHKDINLREYCDSVLLIINEIKIKIKLDDAIESI